MTEGRRGEHITEEQFEEECKKHFAEHIEEIWTQQGEEVVKWVRECYLWSVFC